MLRETHRAVLPFVVVTIIIVLALFSVAIGEG